MGQFPLKWRACPLCGATAGRCAEPTVVKELDSALDAVGLVAPEVSPRVLAWQCRQCGGIFPRFDMTAPETSWAHQRWDVADVSLREDQ